MPRVWPRRCPITISSRRLHRLRCARARVLLEITLESVPSVALACGYEDASAFRRVSATESPPNFSSTRLLMPDRAIWVSDRKSVV